MKTSFVILFALSFVISFVACSDDDSGGTAGSSSSASTNGSTVSTITAVRTLIDGGTTTFNHKVTGTVIGLGVQKGYAFYVYDGSHALQFYPSVAMHPAVAIGQNVTVTVTAGQELEGAFQVIGVKDWIVNSTGNAVDYTGSPEISIANQGKVITTTLTVGTAPISAHKSNDWRELINGTYYRGNTGNHSGTAQGTTLEANKTYTIRGVVDVFGNTRAVAIFSATLSGT